ncbi:HAUS augmin-like complex subunit 7 isoform 2-T2 [Pholidichthys leucotaenia]
MAGPLTEEQRSRRIYASLQAMSCPLVEGLYLQEEDKMLQLLSVPSQHRTDILAWICSSIDPNFDKSKKKLMISQDSADLTKEMAALGHQMMLCKADDLDLIRGDASPLRQLNFLEQLLYLVPGCGNSTGHRSDGEKLLNELFSAENLPNLTHMLSPALDLWPSDIKALLKGRKSPKSSRQDTADMTALLQLTQSELEQLQSQCDFLDSETQSPVAFSPTSLRVAASDLQELMATFRHVYETDLKMYCSSKPPSFSNDADIFRRVHQLVLACNTLE